MADVDVDVAAGQPKKRTFKKFSFRDESSSFGRLQSISGSDNMWLEACLVYMWVKKLPVMASQGNAAA